mgnify:CR=1 FL=1
MLTMIAKVLFTVGWLPLFVFRSERFNERRAVATSDERRAMWNVAAAVSVHVTLAEIALRDAGDVPVLRAIIGIAVFLIGFAFWMLARRALVAYGRLLDPSQPPPALVTTGPFAVVRHPLALGVVILALGPAVTAATPLTWVSFVAVVIALARRCMQDEVELRATFGADYERYATTTTARLIPYVW